MARIEVAAEGLARFADAEFRRQVVEKLKALGFRYVSLDLEGFRSGSLNAVLPPEKLQIADRQVGWAMARENRQPHQDRLAGWRPPAVPRRRGRATPSRARGSCDAGDRRPFARRSPAGAGEWVRLAASRSSMGMTNSAAGPLSSGVAMGRCLASRILRPILESEPSPPRSRAGIGGGPLTVERPRIGHGVGRGDIQLGLGPAWRGARPCPPARGGPPASRGARRPHRRPRPAAAQGSCRAHGR